MKKKIAGAAGDNQSRSFIGVGNDQKVSTHHCMDEVLIRNEALKTSM